MSSGKHEPPGSFAGFGRYAGPATLILASLAEGTKHGYALTRDIESFSGVRLAPGTLYEALARLQAQQLIEPARVTTGAAPTGSPPWGRRRCRLTLTASDASPTSGCGAWPAIGAWREAAGRGRAAAG